MQLKQKELHLKKGDVISRAEFSELCAQLMDFDWVIDGKKYNLLQRGWRFGINNRKTAIGLCSYRKKTVYLSEHFFPSIEEGKGYLIEDTLRHEIAHALDFLHNGRNSKHGRPWQRICLQVGAEPTTSTNGCKTKKGKYTATCPGCGNTKQMHRKRKYQPACRTCCVKKHGAPVFDPEFIFEITQNY
jgi:predicted SprT family Zn-dependent metalloprotease